MIKEKDFDIFPKQDFPAQTMNERLVYDGKNIIYGPNGSSMEYKFFRINHYSKLADDKFREEHGKNSLEIIIEE